MAKSNILKTQDTTFLELIGNGKIYRVPPFQRDYSWDVEHWEDLWNDIQELNESADARHYMGALVVEARSDREFLIIDGQQRIATLSVFALAVIDTLLWLPGDEKTKDENRDRAVGLRSRFIGEKDPASLLESSKLFLNETDDAFYQDYLVQLRAPNNPRGLPKSNRLLWECFLWFQGRLRRKYSDGVLLASVLSEVVARRLLFIKITVEDELSAYTVFETLNARGLELSATDLLKNYLFSRVRVESDLVALQRRWKALIATVKQEKFPDFLRYHLLCDSPKIRKQRLFKEVRDVVKTPQDVFQLMQNLESRAELFAALDDVGHEYWIENQEAKEYIRELKLFKVKQMTPLMFAAWETLSRDDFARVLKMVSAISFRYTVISGLNTNELEPVYHRAAKALLNGHAKTATEVFAQLKDIYVNDEKFIHDFSVKEIETKGQRKHLAKYILCALERDCSGKNCDDQTDPGTIEHILPENPSEEWNDLFDVERQGSFIYRIGNLTLLENTLNRQVGNGFLAAKTTSYQQSKYQITRNIGEHFSSEWTPKSIDTRQSDLAKRAAHLWRSDFA